MKILALDAGRSHCNVSRSVETAARSAESCGAEVIRMRLSDMRIRSCMGCKLCLTGAGCKINDDLVEISERIAWADGVILGVSNNRKHRSRECNSMLDRLSAYFGHDGQLLIPGLSEKDLCCTRRASATRLAIIITASTSDTPIGAFFSPAKGTIRELRAILTQSGMNPIGSIEVTPGLSEGRLNAITLQQSVSMGRILAGKC